MKIVRDGNFQKEKVSEKRALVCTDGAEVDKQNVFFIFIFAREPQRDCDVTETCCLDRDKQEVRLEPPRAMSAGEYLCREGNAGKAEAN